ncbi:hypothetical protein SSALIVM18_08931 [Streptococcus salivarius M18]|nr:hypothetical protein SSALIVM18_08931 [Streptococcus salivarius M18]
MVKSLMAFFKQDLYQKKLVLEVECLHSYPKEYL